jgi:hypothetical protein
MNASLVRTRRHWLHLLSTSLFLAIALMAFGVRPWTSLLSGFVVTLQSFLGLRLLQLMRLSSSKYLDELLGPGFVVGAAIWTIPIQLVSSSQSAAVIGCVLFTVLSLITFGMSAHETTDRLGSTCLIFGLTLIAMSSEWPSLVLPGLLLIGITKFAARVKKLMWLPALMATMLIPLAFSRSHDSWWLVSEELNYYEALRSHLLDFGIWESWGPTNLALYHWFSYAWGTQLSAVSFAGDFVGVGKISPLIFTLTFAASAIAVVRRLQALLGFVMHRLTNTAILGLILLFLALRIDYASPSGVLAFAVSTSAYWIVLNSDPIDLRFKIFGAGLLLSLTLFTKFVYLPATAAVVITSLVVKGFRSNKAAFSTALTAVATSILGYLIFLRLVGPILSNGTSPAWELRLQGRGVSDLIRRVIGFEGFGALLPMFSVAFLTLVTRRDRQHSIVATTSIAIGLSLAVVSQALIEYQYSINVNVTFFKVALVFPLLAIACSTSGHSNRRDTSLALTSGVVGFVMTLDQFQESQPFDAVLRTIRGFNGSRPTIDFLVSQYWFLPSVIVLLAVGIGKRKSTDRSLESTFQNMTIALVAMLTLSATYGRVLPLLESGSYFENARASIAETVLGSQDARATGEWLKANTDRKSVFATNDLYPLNAGSFSSEGDYTNHYGTNFTLAFTSRRRFLILGPRFAYENPQLRDFSVQISREFGEALLNGSAASPRLQAELLAMGVDYFVLLNEDTVQTNSPALNTLYRNGTYSVLDLRAVPTPNN